MGFSPDSFPLVGKIPGKINEWISAGYGGHGMPRTFLCGKALAEMVAQKAAKDKVKLPMVYLLRRERIASWAQESATKIVQNRLGQMSAKL